MTIKNTNKTSFPHLGSNKIHYKNTNKYYELIINREPLEIRIALLINGILEKLDIENIDKKRIVGSIFKGIIQNLEQGLKAAFVNIGFYKNAFLHYWDIFPTFYDNIEIVKNSLINPSSFQIKDINQKYKAGSEIIVQIIKDQIGNKGPRITTNISIPGQFIVLTPYYGQCGISRKIKFFKERDRLKRILKSLIIPIGMGIIIRTAGEGKLKKDFFKDLYILLQKWQNIKYKIQKNNAPILLNEEPDIITRTIRDFLNKTINKIIVDSSNDKIKIENLLSQNIKHQPLKVSIYNKSIPIFEKFDIEAQIDKTFFRHVFLPLGASIIIDETETLTAIDVNTKSHKSFNSFKDYILQTNLEAVNEISRQIKLRNIGGLIIIDFIDMKNKKNRKEILKIMLKKMMKDKAKNQILPISSLGIMQITRQRNTTSNFNKNYDKCFYCKGKSVIKSSRTISIEIQRCLISITKRLRQYIPFKQSISFKILLNSLILTRIRYKDEIYFNFIENEYNIYLLFKSSNLVHKEKFQIFNLNNNYEIELN